MRKQLFRLSLIALLTLGMVLARPRLTLEPSGGAGPTIVGIAQASSNPASNEEVLALVSEAVNHALGPGGFANLIRPEDKVFIKLNANELAVPGGLPPHGYLTDPRVARAVANLVLEIVPAAQIKVGEGISHPDSARYDDFMWGGYDDDLDGYLDGAPGVQLVCLNEPHDPARATDPAYVTRFDNAPGHQNTTWWIPNAMAQADVRISVPVLKSHQDSAGLTCGLKNNMGVLPADIYLFYGSYNRYVEVRTDVHAGRNGVPGALADIAAVVPYHFVVVDALTAHRYGPWASAPDRIYPRAIVAGRDAVAVDTAVASIVGWDPTAIDYLVYCHNDGTGTADPGYIAVRGVSVEALRNDLKTRYPGKIPFPLGIGAQINGGNGTRQGDTTAPWVAVSSPGEGETVAGVVEVFFDCGDNRGVVRAELRVDGLPVDQSAYPGASARLAWDAGGAEAGDRLIEVVVYDDAFHEASASRAVRVATPGCFLEVY